MKKFLCYDTNDVASGKIDVDSRGVLKSAGSSAQPDWNVTDSADPAFIKNKPFGDEKGAVIRSVSGLSWSENTHLTSLPYSYLTSDISDAFPPLTRFTNPEAIRVEVDGVIYNNLTIEQANDGNFNTNIYSDNCPVYIQSTLGIDRPDYSQVMLFSNSSDIKSVRVIDLDGEGEIVKKIDAQYLYQADWNENNSSSPAYILNKPESLGGGVTWFSGSGDDSGFAVRRGKNYEDGVSVTGTEIINAFESGVCRFNVTIVSCCDNYNTNGTMTCYYVNNDSIKCYVTGCYGDAISSTRTLVSESIAL